MNIALWIVQVLLGFFFVVTGHGKIFTPWEQLQHIPWIDGVTPGLMVFIGWAELLGGIGVILPSALRIKPLVAPFSAAGLTLIMILASGFHLIRNEYLLIIPCAVAGAMSTFVMWGRWKKFPIADRTTGDTDPARPQRGHSHG